MARCAEPRQQPHASPQCRKCCRDATLPTPIAPNMSEVLHGGNASDTRIPQYVGSAARSRRSRHLQLQICLKCCMAAMLPTPASPNMSEVQRGRDAYDRLGAAGVGSKARSGAKRQTNAARQDSRPRDSEAGPGATSKGRRAKRGTPSSPREAVGQCVGWPALVP